MDTQALRTHFTNARVRELSCEGNPILTSIDRWEHFGGASLIRGGYIIKRVCDYERVVYPTIDRCEKAVRALGKRLEDALAGRKRYVKRFADGAMEPGGVFPLQQWEGRPVTLYSLDAAPFLMSADGIYIFDRENGPEVRFGYYANTGPTE